MSLTAPSASGASHGAWPSLDLAGRSTATGVRTPPSSRPKCVISSPRSHSVLSSGLRLSMPRIKVLTTAPNAPDQRQCFAHAVTDGVHRRLAGGPLPCVVAADDRVVLDADDCHAIGGGAQIGIARLGHGPIGLGPLALLARALVLWMHAGVG